MTKRELFEVLVNVPDDARILVGGEQIGAVAYDRIDSTIVLDQKAEPFLDSPWMLLYISNDLLRN